VYSKQFVSMSIKTKIQWCDSTVNPVMGCDGCELWPTFSQLRKAVLRHLEEETNEPVDDRRRETVLRIIRESGDLPTDLYHRRRELASDILMVTLDETSTREARESLARAIADPFRCYAGILHTRHGYDDEKPGKITNPGYAEKFENPKLFPGRMAEAARWRDLSGAYRAAKPWLDGLPRLIFVSDMGDALSGDVPFEYLQDEIIANVMSLNGRRHIWLWLTKRPLRMAEFGEWLKGRGVAWPDNLVAMTSVTSAKTTGRIDQLRQVQCRHRGLSIEPLCERVDLGLDGIDWAIVGGESGGGAFPFELEWARCLRDQCLDQSIAFFVKQLGARPIENGQQLPLLDAHGGDWSEWPEDLQLRELPVGFSKGMRIPPSIR